MPTRVLIVDDEPAMLENCQRLLAPEGYSCTTLGDASRFREILDRLQPDVLLLDLKMPAVDGMTVLAAALADDPTLPVVIMTAYATVASAVRAIREGAFDYLAKPFTRDQLILAVERAVRYRGLKLENELLREQVARETSSGEMVGSSRAMVRLMEQVRKVAPSDANVLITGESGTGKELVARSIHSYSLRNAGPFLPMDCAALPEGLLESELFGHERGAFTGAVTRRHGLLAEAAGGTVFLDEIGELSIGLQSKLLRAIEERQIRPVGGTALVDVDFRLVAATNIDLRAHISAGAFRQDLYYRLNVVHLRLPPLRARRGDIPLLAQTFLERFAKGLRKDPPRVSPDVWSVLERHSWPGNVRELKNLAQRLVVLDDDGRVTLSDLPEELQGWARDDGPTTDETLPSYDRARTHALDAFRSAYATRLLAQNDGNVSRAARVAGVSRRTLHRWLHLARSEGQEPSP